MKKYIFTIALIALLSGCDKWNDLIDQFKEKSPWTYSEEVDKLNNMKLFVAKNNYKNKEGTAQADTEFQCDANKILKLKITTFETAVVNSQHPGSALVVETLKYNANYDFEDIEFITKNKMKFTYNKEGKIDYLKTRNGEVKLAFPVIFDKNFNNSVSLALSGVNLSPDANESKNFKSTTGGNLAEVRAIAIDKVLKGFGYQLAADREKIKEFFKAKDWIIEIQTENGVIVAEINLSNSSVKKVFEACSWKPDFLNTAAPAAAPQASAATQAPPQAANQADIDPKDLRTAMMVTKGKWTAGDKEKCQDPIAVAIKDGGVTEVTFKGKLLPSRFMKLQDEVCLKVDGEKVIPWTWLCADGQGAAIGYDEASEQKGAFDLCTN